MHIGFFNYHEIYNQNKMFTDASAPIGDDLLYPTVYLRQYFEERGHRVDTIDMNDINKFDAIVFMDFPTLSNKYFGELVNKGCKNLYLIIFESKVIRPDNWDRENHRYFRKIFTWHDEFVDNKKYFKINFSSKIPAVFDFNSSVKNNLCTMVVANKFQKHPSELYTEREKAIRWFEKNHPEDFDLYGFGWDRHYFRGSLTRLNRFQLLTKSLRPRYSVYRGSIKSKRDVLQKYKFAVCYENAMDIPGYITEKIFDCFFAGCVPVYLGAPNVTEHIPANSFIDKRNFRTYKELYSYIKNMSEEEYTCYLDAIKNFVKSDKIYPFSAECFAETLFREIIERQ
jgi:alpha(1,3/1,4) fucosyltransferase